MARVSTIEKAVEEAAQPTPEEAAIAEARARDDAVFDEFDAEPTEISMDPEQLAELQARSRAFGLGGSLGDDEPAPLMVATTDANGEAIDVEAVRSARSAEADAVTAKPEPGQHTASKNDIPLMGQVILPGFPAGQAVHEVVVNVSGRAILNIANADDRETWESLSLGRRIVLEVDAVVVERAGRLSLDADLEDKKRVAKANVKVTGFHLADDQEEDDEPEISTLSQATIDEAYRLLRRESLDQDEVRDFIESVAILGEPATDTLDWNDEIEAERGASSDSSTSDEEPEPEPSALDEALAIAGEDTEE